MKPTIPKGTRDFDSFEVSNRDYLKSLFKKIFERFCFFPIETPSFEKNEIIYSNYGNEGNKLIFKILNSGDKIKSADIDAFNREKYSSFTNSISNKSLRYDLTVPFARYVAQNQNKITFPFKRYQIQKVWRADRPQKGRFQEFFQCDADSIGSISLWQEIELIQLCDQVFTKLEFKNIILKINHRKVLKQIYNKINPEISFKDFTIILDKIDKVGIDNILDEFKKYGFSNSQKSIVKKVINFTGSNIKKLDNLKNYIGNIDKKCNGFDDLKFIFKKIQILKLKSIKLVLDFSLARGLDYYTDSIFEIISSDNPDFGSIGAGGRYSDLTSVFGLKNISGVGISFGFERIYEIIKKNNKFTKEIKKNPIVLILNYGDEFSIISNNIVTKLRENEINSEYFPDKIKIKKQLTYANKKNIRFILFYGKEEMESNTLILRDMKRNIQKKIKFIKPDNVFIDNLKKYI